MTGDTAPPPLLVGFPISHVGLSVPDIDAATAWYTEVLGFALLAGPVTIDESSPNAAKVADIYGPRWRALRQAHLAASNGVGLELFQFVEPPETAPDPDFRPWHPGLFHLCLSARDLPALVNRIVAHGGTRMTGIHRMSPRYSLCYCRDPWGTAVEVNACAPTTPGRPPPRAGPGPARAPHPPPAAAPSGAPRSSPRPRGPLLRCATAHDRRSAGSAAGPGRRRRGRATRAQARSDGGYPAGDRVSCRRVVLPPEAVDFLAVDRRAFSTGLDGTLAV